MAHWLIKSAIQRAISLLPRSQKCNEWFQEHVTKSLELGPGDFELKLDFCRRYLDDFLELRPECAAGFTALELGTGWHPTVPIGLYLCGATDIWTFDIRPNLKRAHLKTMLRLYLDYDRDGRLQKLLPRARPERMAQLRAAVTLLERETPEAWLENFHTHALVRDAQKTGLAAHTIDLFFSCVVLEYIPAAVQQGLYAEFRRLASPRAVQIHFINLKDQFASFDRSINDLNFLKYSGAAWRWLDSPMISQTRLRISDYRALLAGAGFEIVKEVDKSAPLSALAQIRLAPEFKKYSPEELLVIEAWLVSCLKPST